MVAMSRSRRLPILLIHLHNQWGAVLVGEFRAARFNLCIREGPEWSWLRARLKTPE